MEYTLEEVSKHNKKDDLWIIIDDYIFNLTSYQYLHPGGSKILQKYAGKDCTQIFNDINHVDATNTMDLYCLGQIKKN